MWKNILKRRRAGHGCHATRFAPGQRKVTAMPAEVWRSDGFRLGATAVALLLAQWAQLRLAPSLSDEATAPMPAALAFVAASFVAGLAWLWASPAVQRLAAPAGLAALFAFGLWLRLAWLDAPVVLDTDWLRYLWDGGLAAAGLSPWGPPPVAGLPDALPPEAAALHAILPFAGLRSIYPATAQLAFLLAHGLAPWDILGLRLVMLAAELAGLAVLILLLRRMGRGPAGALLWWCCPLPPLVLMMAVHVDALLLPLVGGAVLATLAGRGVPAGLLLGLAAGVKLWPLLLAPLLGRWLPAQARWADQGLADTHRITPVRAGASAVDRPFLHHPLGRSRRAQHAREKRRNRSPGVPVESTPRNLPVRPIGPGSLDAPQRVVRRMLLLGQAGEIRF